MKRDNFNDKDYFDNNEFNLISKQVENLQLSNIDIIKDSSNFGNFNNILIQI